MLAYMLIYVCIYIYMSILYAKNVYDCFMIALSIMMR